MQALRDHLRPLRKHLCIFAFWLPLLAALMYTSLFSKAAGFIFINHAANRFLDYIFNGLSFLGDGLSSLIIIAFFFAISKRRIAGSLLASFAVSGLISILCKAFFHAPRPLAYSGTEAFVRAVPGVVIHGSNSFPSGHTITAFAVFVLLALTVKQQWPAYIFLVTAWLVGYSRVYLGQHFPIDVCAGALIGTFTAVSCYHLYNNTIIWRRLKITSRQFIKKSFLADWPFVEQLV